MADINVNFDYEKVQTTIQCNSNDNLKKIINTFLFKSEKKEDDLDFFYNEIKIDKKLTFNELAIDIDKKNKEMNITVKNNEETKTKNKIKEIISKDIICPECKEIALIEFNNFKINFKDCKSKHKINDISLNVYENSQKINLNNIICEICQLKNMNETNTN